MTHDDYKVSKSELLQALRKPGNVYASVRYTDNDLVYNRIVKSDFIAWVEQCDDGTRFNAQIDSDRVWID